MYFGFAALIKNKIGLIDNQDAVIGHPVYDIASLIDDVRTVLSKKDQENLIKYYIKYKWGVKLTTAIAIDGPAGAGKSTIARLLAEKLNYTYLDSGAMYRAVTLKALENNIDVNNKEKMAELVKNLDSFPVFEKGRKIRNSYDFPGSNVNFVQQIDANTFRVRTYEKGVEDETLACGTGVTAVAIAMHKTHKTKDSSISLPVEGGNLEVSFTEEKGVYTNVFLKGPAEFVFKGFINI